MGGVNRVFLLGRLGKDPEVRYTQGGTTVANMRLATSERVPNGQGGFTEKTEWHTVVVFGKQADAVKTYLKKGSECHIEGSLRTRKWQAQDGRDRYSTEVVANAVQFVGSRRDGGGASGGGSVERGSAASAPAEGGFGDSDFGGDPDEDIPF